MSNDERRAILSIPVYCEECGRTVKIWENKYGKLTAALCPCRFDDNKVISFKKLEEILEGLKNG